MKRLNKLLLASFVFLVACFWVTHFSTSFIQVSAQGSGIAVNCTNGGAINVSEYVAPRCDGSCPAVGGSSIGEGFAYIGNVTNFVEWLDPGQGFFKQNSNDIHFLYQDNGSTIDFMQDTIWGGGPANGFFTCDGSSDQAFYRVYSSDGSWGRPILATSMSCGETYTSSGYLKAFRKNPDLTETNPMVDESQLQECNVSGQSNIETTGTQQLIFEGTAICNALDPIDVIVTTNLSGAGAGEAYVYCKGYGLCGWYQTLDFDVNPPTDWDETTDVCNLEGASTTLNRDPYYVEPINGMYDYEKDSYPEPYIPEIFNKIYEDLIAQGYQAYCSIPNLNAIASHDANNLMLEDMMGISGNQAHNESPPGNRVYVDLDDYKQFYNYIDAQAPLWRKKGIFVLKDKDSLEGFWSHKDEFERAGFVSSDFSPAYTLLTPEDQCREKMKILAAVDSKCKTLQNEETCALDIAFDPNSSSSYDPGVGPENYSKGVTYKSLYAMIDQQGFSCERMKDPLETLNNTELIIRESLLDMPFTIPKAYRYAFAVYSADLREPRIPGETGALWSNTTHKPGFDFLRYDPNKGTDQEAKPRSEVRIIAFLIPDFGTNQDNMDFVYTPPPEAYFPNKGPIMTKQHEATYGSPNDWNDAIKIARDALQTPELQEDFDKIWLARKTGSIIPDPFNPGEVFDPFKDVREMYNPDSETTKLIECLYYNEEPISPQYYQYGCIEPFQRALTTFVNRRIENPESCHQDVVKWEENQTIYDDAGIARADAGLYHLYNGTNVHAQSGIDVPYNGDPVHMLDNGLYPNQISNVIPNTDDTSLEPVIEDEKKRVYEFRFLSHFAFSSFYDGSDPIYRDSEPERDEETKVKIHGYLVYPMGYELEAAEDTFLNAFLTPEEIEQFNTEFEEDDRDIWFKMKGIVQSMPTKEVEYEVEGADFSRPDRFMFVDENECLSMYDSYVRSLPPDQSPISYESYKWSNCMKVPSAKIESEPQKDKEPRILGARFGLITIKIQQTLREQFTPSWEYITSCLESDTPTEDFLTGRCSGLSESQGRRDTEDDPELDYMNQAVAVCNGGPRVVNSIGDYQLPPSEYACTINDSLDSTSGINDCDPSDPELADNCAVEYTDSVHGIDNWLSSSDRIDCNDAFYSFVACSFNEDTGIRPSLIAHKVDSSGKFTPDGNKTACEYVQDRAAEQNVSPRLALSIWLEETGASAYTTETGGPDFGVLSAPTSRESGTIEPQLRLFLGTINSNRNIGYPRFLLQYSGEYLYGVDPDQTWRNWTEGDPVLFCRNRGFAGRLKNFYEQLGNY